MRLKPITLFRTAHSLVSIRNRQTNGGIVLLTTMILILLVASVIALTQARAQASRLAFARLERSQTDALADIAVRERLRPIVADILTAPDPKAVKLPLNGTPFDMRGDGYKAEVRLNDVDGLIDLYFAPKELLAVLPDGEKLTAGRDVALAKIQSGERFLVVEATLAGFGLGLEARQALEGLVTQSGVPGVWNLANSPRDLRGMAGLPMSSGTGAVRALRVGVGIARAE